jgi:hypothetical protein
MYLGYKMDEQVKDMQFYSLADAMGINLHEMPDGRVRGFETRKIKIGPWAIEADVSVIGDIKRPAELSFFVKVLGNVWLYMVDDPQGLRAVVFDGSAVKMHVKDCATFGGKSVKDTLTKLKPGIVTTYGFDQVTHKWVEYEVGHLVQQPNVQSPVLALPSPTPTT